MVCIIDFQFLTKSILFNAIFFFYLHGTYFVYIGQIHFKIECSFFANNANF